MSAAVKSASRRKLPALPVRDVDAFSARPSSSEPGQWTIMQQIAGETHQRLFARARDRFAARRILAGLAFTSEGFAPVLVDYSDLDAACPDCGEVLGHKSRCVYGGAS